MSSCPHVLSQRPGFAKCKSIKVQVVEAVVEIGQSPDKYRLYLLLSIGTLRVALAGEAAAAFVWLFWPGATYSEHCTAICLR